MSADIEVTVLAEEDDSQVRHMPKHVGDLEQCTRSFERWISVIVNQPLYNPFDHEAR